MISNLDEDQFTIITYLLSKIYPRYNLSQNIRHQKHTNVTCTQVIYHFSKFYNFVKFCSMLFID